MANIQSRSQALRVAVTVLILGSVPSIVRAQSDIVGAWGEGGAGGGQFFEERNERATGPALVDFLGIPWNEAGRARALSYDGSLLTVPEHQCMPHPSTYNFWGPANLRIAAELDANLGLVAYHVGGTFRRADRTIWMDGRPHPPDYAPHTWSGFTTGRWVGNTLVTQTTHIKWAWVKRNGSITSDQATVTTFYTRNGSILTVTWVVNDPLYLAEPYIKSADFLAAQMQVAQFGGGGGGGGGGGLNQSFYKCYASDEVSREDHFVPHYLPWANPFTREFATQFKLPPDATLGGPETMYPEYRDKLPR